MAASRRMSPHCVVHPDVGALNTCGRCGRFACDACLRDGRCEACRGREAPRAFSPWLLAASGATLALPLLGDISPAFAELQMGSLCLALPLGLGALVMARRERLALLCLAPLALAVVLSSHVTLGVPHWVKWNAEPLIAPLEAWASSHGADVPLPPELEGQVRARGCSFTRREGDWSLTCHGVAFTKCTRRGATGEWYAWD